jgi:PAS domain S-box-containing protein
LILNSGDLKNANCEIIGCVVTLTDITERKRVEDLINTSAINLSRAEILANLGHWDWDLTTKQVKWSDGHFRIFGYTVAHGTETYEMWRYRVHPEDIEDIERVLREGMERDTGYNWDYRLVLPDGSIRYIHAEADRLVKDAAGKPVRWFGLVQDITSRKKLEEQIRQRAEELETLMEVAPVAIWVGHDPQSHYITGNREANEFYEAEFRKNVPANVTTRFFYKGCELTEGELPMQEVSLKDIDIRNAELEVLLPGGEWRSILGSASPLHDAQGNVRGSVGAFIDITERKKAEVKLKYTLDNLDKLVKVRTAELEKAYSSLEKSKKSLAEAQRIAHIGN